MEWMEEWNLIQQVRGLGIAQLAGLVGRRGAAPMK